MRTQMNLVSISQISVNSFCLLVLLESNIRDYFKYVLWDLSSEFRMFRKYSEDGLINFYKHKFRVSKKSATNFLQGCTLTTTNINTTLVAANTTNYFKSVQSARRCHCRCHCYYYYYYHCICCRCNPKPKMRLSLLA